MWSHCWTFSNFLFQLPLNRFFVSEFNDVVREACAAVVMTSIQVDTEVIDSAPRLKILSNFGVGYDNINVKYAHEKKIVVTNTPDVLTTSCAELGVALVMAVARRLA